MRSLAIVMMLIVITSSVALANDWGDILQTAGKVLVLRELDQRINEQSAERAPLRPVAGLGTAVVRVSRSWYWDDEQLETELSSWLSRAGFQMFVADPESYGESRAFSQLSEYTVWATVLQGNGPRQRFGGNTPGGRFDTEQEQVWARCLLRITRGRLIIAVVEAEESDRGSRFSGSAGNWDTGGYFERENPSREDLAIRNACATAAFKAAQAVSVKSQPQGWGDPGEPIQCPPERTTSRTGFCPACGAPAAADWQFCPKCGTKLPH